MTKKSDKPLMDADYRRWTVTDEDYRSFHLPYTLTAAQQRLWRIPEPESPIKINTMKSSDEGKTD